MILCAHVSVTPGSCNNFAKLAWLMSIFSAGSENAMTLEAIMMARAGTGQRRMSMQYSVRRNEQSATQFTGAGLTKREELA